MQAAYERGILNGTVLVATAGEVIYEGEFGFADGARTEPLRAGHRFNIGSVSKEFSAVSLMMLAERGDLHLDAPVSSFLPELPGWADEVRVQHLLTYTSGLPRVRRDVTSETEILADLQALPALAFTPGTDHLYSNNNVVLRQQIIEAVTGGSYGAFLRSEVFGPCGMTGAVLDPDPTTALVPAAFDDAGTVDDGVIPFADVPYVTARDLYRWSECLRGDALVSPASLLHLTKAHKGGKAALGQSGVEDGAIMWHGHIGSSYNFEAGYYANRADDLTVVILTNNKNFQIGSLAVAVEAMLKGDPYEVPKKSLYLALRTKIEREGYEAGAAFFREIRANARDVYDFSDEEDALNDTGYYLLRKERIEDAIRVFELNVTLFPESANVYDSLGEAYLAAGDERRAAANYRRALELDPANDHARNVLDRLTE